MDDNGELSTVGSLLANFRNREGITQAELGARIGLTENSISRIERNIRSLSRSNLLLISKELQLDAADTQALEDARRRALPVKHLPTKAVPEPPVVSLPQSPLSIPSIPLPPSPQKIDAPVPPARGRPLRLQWQRMVALLMLACVLGSLLITLDAPVAQAQPTAMPLGQAAVDGWLLAKAGPAHGMATLVSINPRSGEQHPLWPDAQELRTPNLTADATDFNSPALALATHQLAFVATDLAGQRRIWVGTLGLGADGWPGFISPPQSLLALCAGCHDIVAWSPTGHWLIYKGLQGLMAFAPSTGEARPLTNSARDAWPACAPNGQWLAYQGAWGGVVVLPTQDCLPRYPHLQHAHYVHGISFGWHPAWSLDSRMLAFESNDAPGQLLYTVAASAISEGLHFATSDPVRPIGNGQCNYLIWAMRLKHRAAVMLLVCHPPPLSADLGTIAIQPDAPTIAWRAVIHGGTLAWDHLCWLPPITTMRQDETLPGLLA